MFRLRTLYRPGCPMALKYCLASFQADSTASEPLVVKNTRFRSPGPRLASRSPGWAARRGPVGPQREIGPLAALPGAGLRHLGPAVPDLADEQAGQAVQVALAVLVEDVLAGPADDDRNVGVVVGGHAGEVQPHVPLGALLQLRDLLRAVLSHLIPSALLGPPPWSSRSPAVALLAELQVDERLGHRDARDRPHPGQDLQQLVVVLADHLDQQVEGPRGDHDVVDLR